VLPADATPDTEPVAVRTGKGEIPIGWVNPFASEKAALTVVVDGEQIPLKDIGRRAEIQLKAKKVKLCVSRVGENTLVALEDLYSALSALEKDDNVEAMSSNSKEESVVEVDVQMGHDWCLPGGRCPAAS